MRLRPYLFVLALAAGCTSSTKVAPTTAAEHTTPAPAPVDPEALARGTYVAQVAGCVVCHTPRGKDGAPDMKRLFAGGLESRGPNGKGVWRASNITPDPTTGIGKWTDEQIVTAIRTGVRPDNTRLAPIMPYPYYHAMNDADARSLVVFLRAQQPIVNRVGRSAGLAVQPVVMPPPAANADRPEDPVAHGKYIAQLMHCGVWHPPQDGAHAGETFAGGMPFDASPAEGGGTIFAPNITSDTRTGIGSWTEDNIVVAVREMKTPEGVAIHGPMAMYKDSWSRLTDADVRALAAYVKSVPAVENEILHSQRQAWLNRRSKTSRP